MPKMKTHKGTKKRFRLSGSGKAKHRQSGTSHLQSRMSSKRKRNLRGTTVADKTLNKMITRALNGNGYSVYPSLPVTRFLSEKSF